jgi:hypothetical protein
VYLGLGHYGWPVCGLWPVGGMVLGRIASWLPKRFLDQPDCCGEGWVTELKHLSISHQQYDHGQT